MTGVPEYQCILTSMIRLLGENVALATSVVQRNAEKRKAFSRCVHIFNSFIYSYNQSIIMHSLIPSFLHLFIQSIKNHSFIHTINHPSTASCESLCAVQLQETHSPQRTHRLTNYLTKVALGIEEGFGASQGKGIHGRASAMFWFRFHETLPDQKPLHGS